MLCIFCKNSLITFRMHHVISFTVPKVSIGTYLPTLSIVTHIAYKSLVATF